MKYAIGVKLVALIAMTRSDYDSYVGRFTDRNKDEDEEGYLVEYIGQGNSNHIKHQNYISWTTKKVADDSYFPIEDSTKISHADVEAFIVPGEPMKLGDKTTIVLDTTLTGFYTLASSACVDPNNFELEIGAKIARKDITDKIWGHLGFVLQWAKNGLKFKTKE